MAKRSRQPRSKSSAPASNPTGPLEDPGGLLSIPIAGGTHDGQTITLDLLMTRLKLEQVERQHDCHKKGWSATPEFLVDLIAVFESNGVNGCTANLACALWHRVVLAWNELKKNTS